MSPSRKSRSLQLINFAIGGAMISFAVGSRALTLSNFGMEDDGWLSGDMEQLDDFIELASRDTGNRSRSDPNRVSEESLSEIGIRSGVSMPLPSFETIEENDRIERASCSLSSLFAGASYSSETSETSEKPDGLVKTSMSSLEARKTASDFDLKRPGSGDE